MAVANSFDKEFMSVADFQEIYPNIKVYRKNRGDVWDAFKALKEAMEREEKELGADGCREALAVAEEIIRESGLGDVLNREISIERYQFLKQGNLAGAAFTALQNVLLPQNEQKEKQNHFLECCSLEKLLIGLDNPIMTMLSLDSVEIKKAIVEKDTSIVESAMGSIEKTKETGKLTGMFLDASNTQELSQNSIEKLIQAGLEKESTTLFVNCLQFVLFLISRKWDAELGSLSIIVAGSKEEFLAN